MEEKEEGPIRTFPRLRAVQAGGTHEPPNTDWLSPMVIRQCFLAKKKGEKARLHLFQIVDRVSSADVDAGKAGSKVGEGPHGFCLKGEDGIFVWVDPKAYCEQFSLYIDLGVVE